MIFHPAIMSPISLASTRVYNSQKKARNDINGAVNSGNRREAGIQAEALSLVASLVRTYERLPYAPEFDYSLQKIGFCVVLNPDGSVAEVTDLSDHDKNRKPRSRHWSLRQ